MKNHHQPVRYQFPVEIMLSIVGPAAQSAVKVAMADAQVDDGRLIDVIRSQIDVIQDNVTLHPPVRRLLITS